MVNKCAACGCRTGYKEKDPSTGKSVVNMPPGVSLHRFPVDNQELLKKWINQLRRKDKFTVKDHSRICSLHLKQGFFNSGHQKLIFCRLVMSLLCDDEEFTDLGFRNFSCPNNHGFAFNLVSRFFNCLAKNFVLSVSSATSTADSTARKIKKLTGQSHWAVVFCWRKCFNFQIDLYSLISFCFNCRYQYRILKCMLLLIQ